MQKQVVWQALYFPGEEKLNLIIDENGAKAKSVISWHDEKGSIHKISYQLVIRPDWSIEKATIKNHTSAKTLDVVSDGVGNWTTTAGEALPALKGCVDIDFQATPFTNILPIRRLDAKVGEKTALNMAYITFPDLQIYPVKQYYTLLGNSTWLFEQPVDDFTATIEVDEVGLVKDYPGLFKRLKI